ncbi:hypothetical protein G5I_07709 [Acromyrmex echinatior]|uniref:Uncharacterized protein n=1 Tax=Acromyrmex echinatior TaxID=103372 RepID=F4WPJ4_ACREC|nr:hypothetical protein G5I_07709 [Acromyrmex echinatior]
MCPAAKGRQDCGGGALGGSGNKNEELSKPPFTPEEMRGGGEQVSPQHRSSVGATKLRTAATSEAATCKDGKPTCTREKDTCSVETGRPGKAAAPQGGGGVGDLPSWGVRGDNATRQGEGCLWQPRPPPRSTGPFCIPSRNAAGNSGGAPLSTPIGWPTGATPSSKEWGGGGHFASLPESDVGEGLRRVKARQCGGLLPAAQLEPGGL